MRFFRQKIWVIFFFVLISVGQGFGLSYVLNFSRASAVSLHPTDQILICGHQFEENLQESPKPQQKLHEELLSLRVDPFLPSLFSFPILQTQAHLSKQKLIFISSLRFSPPEKPPRLFS